MGESRACSLASSGTGNRFSEIIGTGSCVPEKVITNFDLEKMVDTSDEWIRQRTGIVERHIVDDDMATSDLAIEASLSAIEKSGIKPKDIDAIITATFTSDNPLPTAACQVQAAIGTDYVPAFDLAAACSGFVYALDVADSFIKTGKYDTVLVIAAETLSTLTNWTDRSTCVLFGDAAGAAIVQVTDEEKGILASYLGADGSQGDLIKIPAGGSRCPPSQKTVAKDLYTIKMQGREVFKLGVKLMPEAAQKALERAGLSTDDVDLLIPHQANIRIINVVGERLGIPREKIYINIDKYGNTSGSTVILAMDEALREGRINAEDIVLLTTFGGGVTWSGAVIRF